MPPLMLDQSSFHIAEPVGGVPIVVKLAADPETVRVDRELRSRGRACDPPRFEEAPLFGKERMLLNVRDADVIPFTGRFHHQVERVGPVSMARSIASAAACRSRAFLSVLLSMMRIRNALRFAPLIAPYDGLDPVAICQLTQPYIMLACARSLERSEQTEGIASWRS